MNNSPTTSQLARMRELLAKRDTEPSDKTLIVDGNNTFIRSYARNPKIDENVIHIGGITGFLYSIGYAMKQFSPERCVIVFDGKGGSIARRKIFEEYKCRRKTKKNYNRISFNKDDNGEFKDYEMKLLMQILDSLPIHVIALDGIEADDVIAFICKKYFKDKIVMSSDMDFLQLVSDNVSVWSPTKKKLYSVGDVENEFGIPAKNFIYYKIILGDRSDNIDGIKGIGKKRIEKYLYAVFSSDINNVDEFISTIENVEQNKYTKLLLSKKDKIYRNYKLMNLQDGGFINGHHFTQIANILKMPVESNKYAFIKLVSSKQILGRKNPLQWFYAVFGLIIT